MRQSVLSVLAVAALATSVIAFDGAAARDHGGGGGPGAGAGSAAPSGGQAAPSGGQGSAGQGMSGSSGGRGASFGRASGPSGAAPSVQSNGTVQSNRSAGSPGGDRRVSGGNFDRGNFHHHRHHRNFAFGFYDGGYYNDYAYDYEADCYRLRHVHTRAGWRWRRIYVCD
jgi:hypothetical protein